MNNVKSQRVNSNTYLFFQGVGQLIALELLFVTGGESKPELGEVTDVTAQHLIRFEPQNPHTTEEKKLIIRNSTYVATINRVMVCSLNILVGILFVIPSSAKLEKPSCT